MEFSARSRSQEPGTRCEFPFREPGNSDTPTVEFEDENDSLRICGIRAKNIMIFYKKIQFFLTFVK